MKKNNIRKRILTGLFSAAILTSVSNEVQAAEPVEEPTTNAETSVISEQAQTEEAQTEEAPVVEETEPAEASPSSTEEEQAPAETDQAAPEEEVEQPQQSSEAAPEQETLEQAPEQEQAQSNDPAAQEAEPETNNNAEANASEELTYENQTEELPQEEAQSNSAENNQAETVAEQPQQQDEQAQNNAAGEQAAAADVSSEANEEAGEDPAAGQNETEEQQTEEETNSVQADQQGQEDQPSEQDQEGQENPQDQNGQQVLAATAATTAAAAEPAEQAAASTTAAAAPAQAETTQATDENTIEIGGEAVELTEEKPEVAPVPVVNQPNRINAQLSTDTQTEMNFRWFTTDYFEDAQVLVSENPDMTEAEAFEAVPNEFTTYYMERNSDGNFIFHEYETDENGDPVLDENGDPVIKGYFTDAQISADNKEWTGGAYSDNAESTPQTEYSYTAQASGLTPNTTYYYTLGSNDSGYMSDIGTFTTSGEAGDEFSFIHYTDTQNAWWNENVRNEADYAENVLETAIDVAEDADFALHTGDIVEVPLVEDEWTDMLNSLSDGMQELPHVFVSGNHDGQGSFNNHIAAPITNGEVNEGSYYSFDYNGVHFAIANSDDDGVSEDNPNNAAMGQEQLEWLDQDLTQARENGAETVVLAFHRPMYSSSYHSLEDETVQRVRDDLMSIIDKHDVDLVLNGHDHVLTATYPLVYSDDNFALATTDPEVEVVRESEDVTRFVDPEGTMFIIPNTAGTKLYDDIYNTSLEHIQQVRPGLADMTQEELDHYNSFFAISNQPTESVDFETSHQNSRDGSVQNFAEYTFADGEIIIDLYQISGDLGKGEERAVELIHTFIIDQTASEVPAPEVPVEEVPTYEEVVEELDHLQNQVDDLQAENDRQNETIAGLQNEVKELQNELAALNDQVDNYRGQLNKLAERVDQLEENAKAVQDNSGQEGQGAQAGSTDDRKDENHKGQADQTAAEEVPFEQIDSNGSISDPAVEEVINNETADPQVIIENEDSKVVTDGEEVKKVTDTNDDGEVDEDDEGQVLPSTDAGLSLGIVGVALTAIGSALGFVDKKKNKK